MKIKMYFLLLSIFTSILVVSAPGKDQEPFVTFPPKDVLEKSLPNAAPTDFNVADLLKITQEQVTPEQLYGQVDILCSDWANKFIKDNGTERMGSRHVLGIYNLAENYKLRLLHVLLQDDPKALETLKANKSDLNETHYSGGRRGYRF